MKKALLIFTLLALWSCKEDQPMEDYQFLFNVDISKDDEDIYVNSLKELNYSIETDYIFDGVPMTIEVRSDNNGLFQINGEPLTEGEPYTIQNIQDDVTYQGLEEGEHNLTLDFVNSQDVVVQKEVNITFMKRSFDIEVDGVLNDIPQGTENIYRLRVADNFVGEEYQIKFNSYDSEDIELEVSSITINGIDAEFDTWYEIEDKRNIELRLFTPNFGSKPLKYDVKNNSDEMDFVLVQDISERLFETIFISGENQEVRQGAETKYILGIDDNSDENDYQIRFDSYELNDPNFENSYIDFNDSRIELGEWYVINNKNNFRLTTQTSLTGNKILKYTIKNPFKEKTFTINQNIGGSDFNVNLVAPDQDISQGDNARYFLSIVDGGSSNTYRIKFVSYDTSDPEFENSYVRFNGSDTSLDTWYDIPNSSNMTVDLLTSSSGSLKLNYVIQNNFNSEKPFIIQQNVRQRTYSLDIIDNNAITYQGVEYSYLFNVLGDDYTNETYEINFISYDNDDDSYIKLNDRRRTPFNEWINISKLNVRVATNSATVGRKILRFKIRNRFNLEQDYEISQTISASAIELNNVVIPSYIETPGTFTMKFSYSATPSQSTQPLQYRAWTSKADMLSIFGVTFPNIENNDWRPVRGDNGNFTIDFSARAVDTFDFFVQVRDANGNTSTILDREITVNDGTPSDPARMDMMRNFFTGLTDVRTQFFALNNYVVKTIRLRVNDQNNDSIILWEQTIDNVNETEFIRTFRSVTNGSSPKRLRATVTYFNPLNEKTKTRRYVYNE